MSCSEIYSPSNLIQIKSVQQVLDEVEEEAEAESQRLMEISVNLAKDENAPKKALKKELRIWDLIAYGVGSTVGSGIYSLVGTAAVKAGK